jgi:hypothetical protein
MTSHEVIHHIIAFLFDGKEESAGPVREALANPQVLTDIKIRPETVEALKKRLGPQGPSLEERTSVQVIFLLYDPRTELQETARARIKEALGEDPDILMKCGYSSTTVDEIHRKVG